MPGSLTAPGRSGARAYTRPTVLPSAVHTASAPGFPAFVAQWLAYALPYRRFADANVDTLTGTPRGHLRTARGRCGSLHLHRGGLSPLTPCRFLRRT